MKTAYQTLEETKLHHAIGQLKNEGAFDVAFASLCLYMTLFTELLPAQFAVPALLLVASCGAGYALHAGMCIARAKRFEKVLQRR